MSFEESSDNDVLVRAAAAPEDLVRPQARIRGHARDNIVLAGDDAGHMRAVAVAVPRVVVGRILVARLIAVADKVMAPLNLEAGAETAAQGRMHVVDTRVDDGDPNAIAAVAACVRLGHVGVIVRAPGGKLGSGGGLRCLGDREDSGGPDAFDFRECCELADELGRVIAQVERDAVEEFRVKGRDGLYVGGAVL